MRPIAVILLIVLLITLCSVSASNTGNAIIFNYRLATDPPTLDPALSTDTTSGAVILKIHDGLVQFDPETLEVIPAVASHWTVSPNGLTYTFTLRDDVVFHNGRKVIADDVLQSFKRVLTPATKSGRTFVLDPIKGARAYLRQETRKIDGIEVIDSHTVRLTLEKPFAPFLAQLCMEAASIIPIEETTDPDESFSAHPVGCGPFRFVEWKHDVHVTLAKNPDYYAGTPVIDTVQFKIIQSVPTAFEEYKSGGLDLLDQIPTGQIQTVRQKFPQETHLWPYLSIYYIGFNHSRPPFKDNVPLRQAFNYAIDRQKICAAVKEGLAYPVAGVLPPGIPGYKADRIGYPYDLEKARSLMEAAGYPEGRGLPELTIWYNRDPRHRLIVQCVQHYLKEIGVTVKLKNVEWGAYIEAVDEAEPDMFRMGWVADYPDADNFLFTLLHSSQFGSAGNYSRFSHPEFDRLTESAKTMTDPLERLANYRQAETIAVQQAPWMFIYYEREIAMIKSKWTNVILTPQGDFAIPLESIELAGEFHD